MAKPYIDRVCPQIVANICRICGTLPLSWTCDDQGLPVISHSLFYYSLSLIPALFLLLTMIAVSCPWIAYVKVVYTFLSLSYITLLTVPSLVQCKRGLTKQILRNLKTVDDELKISQSTKITVLISIVCLIEILESYFALDSIGCTVGLTGHCYFVVVNLSYDILMCYTLMSLGNRFKTLNDYFEERCNLNWRTNTGTTTQLSLGM